MGKALAAINVSIDDLLASIRQAIHEEVEPPKSMVSESSLNSDVNRLKAAMERRSNSAVPPETVKNGEAHRSGPPARPGLAPMMPRKPRAEGEVSERPGAARAEAHAAAPVEAPVKPAPKTLLTAKREGFTGILGGDVRLEEALARLSRAGRSVIPPEPASAPLQEASSPAVAEAIPLRSSLSDEPEEEEREAAPPAVAELPLAVRHQPAPERAAASQTGGLHDTPQFKPNGAHSNGHVSPPPAYVAPRLHEMEWPVPQEEARPAPAFAPAFAPQPRLQPDLLSPSVSSSASMAFDRLAEALMSRTTGGDRSLEDVTRDLLRPLLKAWLDENLPGIVERMVREEIERVARRGGAR